MTFRDKAIGALFLTAAGISTIGWWASILWVMTSLLF
jgi:hypothetical protein